MTTYYEINSLWAADALVVPPKYLNHLRPEYIEKALLLESRTRLRLMSSWVLEQLKSDSCRA